MGEKGELCRQLRGHGRKALPVLIALLASCASIPEIGGGDQTRLDVQINEALNRTCPVPRDPGADQDKMRILRAQLILASIAGYASRSISSYAVGDEVKSDGTLVLERLKDAGGELAGAKAAVESGNHLFPLYRADLIVAAGSAAEAALRPTLRAAKAAVTSLPAGLSSDAMLRAKAMLLNLLKDELYLEALKESCDRLNKVVVPPLSEENYKKAGAFTDQRLKNRCDGLEKLARGEVKSEYCKVQWAARKE
jgi:hypothetical protein